MKKFIQNMNLSSVVKETSIRFPLPVLCSVYLTLVSFLSIAGYTDDYKDFVIRSLIYVTTIFIALTSFTLLREKEKISTTRYLLGSAIIFAFVIWHIYTFFFQYGPPFIIMGILLSLTYAPFILSHKNDKAQCNFNSSLISIIFFTIITVIVLFGGISAIVFSIKYLFQIELPPNIMKYLWVFAVCLFAPFYFLYRLPKNLSDDSELKYSKGLKFVLEYIIAPLLIAYLAVLYAYTLKITFEWSLPKGKVAYLVIVFGFIGVFAFTMLQPISKKTNFFARIIRKYFYHLFSAPLLLLIVGISKRVGNYGITEQRYALILIAVWFSISLLYFIIKKNPSLKVITLSLSVLFILGSFGPWGAYNISANSQKTRLEKLLTENNLMVDGKFTGIQDDTKLTFEENKEISSIVSYLVSTHKISYIKSWLPYSNIEDIQTISSLNYRERNAAEIAIFNALGIRKINRWESASIKNPKFFSFSLNFNEVMSKNMLDIAGYKNLAKFENINLIDKSNWVENISSNNSSETYSINIKNEEGTLVIRNTNKEQVVFDLKKLIRNLKKLQKDSDHDINYTIVDNNDYMAMVMKKETKGMKVKVLVYRIHGELAENKQIKSLSTISFLLMVD